MKRAAKERRGRDLRRHHEHQSVGEGDQLRYQNVGLAVGVVGTDELIA